MKNRIKLILLVSLMISTGMIWAAICVPYWVVKGKKLPVFEKIEDYIFSLTEDES